MRSKPALVLLPGMDGTGILFEPFIAALDDRYAVTVVRYSPQLPQSYAELTEVVMRSLHAEGDFILLGESFSGPLAITVAASRPHGLVGLILCCTFASNPRPAMKSLARLANFMPIPPAAVMSQLLLGRYGTGQVRALLEKAVRSVAPAVLRARFREVLAVDVADRLRRVAVPVLYLQATEDMLVPKAAADAITELAPATELVPLAAPHCLLQAVPDQAARVVASTVERWIASPGVAK